MSEMQRSLWHGASTDTATDAPGQAAASRWPALFAGGSAREILSRIVQGDPLELRDHIARRMRVESYLLDADRVHLRALARCARAAVRYRGRPELGEWLAAIVDESIAELLVEDHEAPPSERHAASQPIGPPHAGAFSALARPLGLDPEAMRGACVLFNRLPAPERRAFFDLVIEGRELDSIAQTSGESATEIARRARRALDVLLSAQTKKPQTSQAPQPPQAEELS
jgi:DNA-directed RNA polymerase specialized sigma24 family protein